MPAEAGGNGVERRSGPDEASRLVGRTVPKPCRDDHSFHAAIVGQPLLGGIRTAADPPRGELRIALGYVKMFTARAATRRMASAEIVDSKSIASFARRVSGIASVGLNAIEFVNET